MPKVTRTRRADRDLEDIAVYIAGDDPNAADTLIDRFDQKFTLLAQFPYLGHERPELATELRSFPVGRYLIFYRPQKDGIIVIRVIHGARNLRRIFRRK
jgi:toxin ParE1/3/4